MAGLNYDDYKLLDKRGSVNIKNPYEAATDPFKNALAESQALLKSDDD